MLRLSLMLAFALCAVLARVAPASPSPRYYVTVFGYENWINAAVFSHSFAQFIEIAADGTQRVVEINWIPAEDHMPGIRPLRMPILGVHPGQNADIATTIARAQQGGPFSRRDVYAYGPYEIRAELFDIAARRAAELSSGFMRYSGLSTVLRQRRAFAPQCVNALDFFADVNPGLARGPGASQAILDSYVRNNYVLDHVPPPHRFPRLYGHRNGRLLRP